MKIKMKKKTANLLTIVICFALSGTAFAQDTVAEIRVHGNYKTTDDRIVELSGLDIGDPAGDSEIAEARKLLMDSGRFASVEIRKRYRSLSGTGPVVLIIVVEEKEALGDKFLYLPILSFTDEYGFTYGARATAIDLFGFNERLSVPFSWGGERRIGLELSLTNLEPVFNQVRLSVARRQQENPHFEIEDTRTEVSLEALRRFDWFVVGAEAGYSEVEFGDIEDEIVNYGLRAAIDTRQSANAPFDAVYLGASWRRFDIEDGLEPDVYDVDLRGYLRLFGRNVLAAQARWVTASEPLPPYLKPFAGGYQTLRGYGAGDFIGDNLFTSSIEIRTTLTDPTDFFKGGIHLFYDAAAVWDDGTEFSDAEILDAAGVGGFFFISGIGLVIDIAYDLEDDVRLHVGSGFRF